MVVDPSVPVDDVSASHRIGTVGMGYTFGLFDKLALLTAIVPYAQADVSGRIAGDLRTASRSGFADARVKFSMNLRGNPAMGARQFARAPERTVIGASVTVAGPTGQYDRARLINIGTNRWSFKPDAGISVPVGRWDIDAYAGVWLFAINDEFFPGTFTRLQDPLLTTQGHVAYTFRPQLWIALNMTWYAGGQSRIEGRNPGPRMSNSRVGMTLSIPAGHQQSIKVAYSAGTIVRAGPNFATLSVGWQKVWLTRD